MTTAIHGQVDKVVRVVGSSPTSWEVAAQAAVSQAAETIQDLRTATLVEADLVLHEGRVRQYRVKLELSFQFDRSRISAEGTGRIRVHRCLIIANQTLASPALREIVAERASSRDCEFHILVPQPVRSTDYIDDTVSGVHLAIPSEEDHLEARQIADERLKSFRSAFPHLTASITGEVSLADPLTAARQVMEFSTFDEIIVSTLAPGVSRWLKLDLPSRLERAFNLPVIPLISD